MMATVTIDLQEYEALHQRVKELEEIIEDKLINIKEVTDELDEKIRTIEEGWKMKCEQQEEETERAKKALDNCQRARIELELEVSRLEHRNWWQRLINK